MVLRAIASSLILLLVLEETESFAMLRPSSSLIGNGAQSSLLRTSVLSQIFLRRGQFFKLPAREKVAVLCSENDFEEYTYDENSSNPTGFIPPKLRGLRPLGICSISLLLVGRDELGRVAQEIESVAETLWYMRVPGSRVNG